MKLTFLLFPLQTCLSAVDLFRRLNIQDGKLNVTSFERACPVILERLESQECSRDQLGPDSTDLKTKPSATEGISPIYTLTEIVDVQLLFL
jgi:hypothetical protein